MVGGCVWAGAASMPTWVVKVELPSDSLDLLFRSKDLVEGVLAQDGHLPLAVVEVILAQQLHDLAAHRRLHRVEQIKRQRWRNRGQLWVCSVLFQCFSQA